jgi:integrase
MDKAGIQDNPHKCPKGLRHGFGVAAISKGIPMNLLSKWMGHASLKVAAIYANALGETTGHCRSHVAIDWYSLTDN